MLRPGMPIIHCANVFVAGDALDGGDVRIQGEQLAMMKSASIRGRHAARRFAGVGTRQHRAIVNGVGSCAGSDRRQMSQAEKSEANSAALTGHSRPVETHSSSAREGRATLQQMVERSFVIKGEVTSTECLYIEGRIEGMIHLAGSRLTVGKTGEVMADIEAREIVVLGNIHGNCRASERVDIRNGGSLMGDVITPRISIDDGAYFKGGVEIGNPAEVKRAVVAVKGPVPAESHDKIAEESTSQARQLKREDGADEDDALPKWKLDERKSAARKTVETR